MSINRNKIAHLEIVCSCMEKLLKAGMTENSAIRHLEFLTNGYAKYLFLGKYSPDHADEYSLWSKAAIHAKKYIMTKNMGNIFV